jgi:hypothetical protein
MEIVGLKDQGTLGCTITNLDETQELSGRADYCISCGDTSQREAHLAGVEIKRTRGYVRVRACHTQLLGCMRHEPRSRVKRTTAFDIISLPLRPRSPPMPS